MTLIAATEAWHTMRALTPEDARNFEVERRRRLVGDGGAAGARGLAAELVLAADTFIISPVGRIADIARAHAEGDEVRTVIAGYHWFTDWGRDTMISLEGPDPGDRASDRGKWILRTFAHYVRDGLIPNMFPEGRHRGALPHRRRDAVVLPRAGALSRALRRQGDLAAHAADAARHRAASPRRHSLRHQGRPARRAADPGRRGLQLTWMDAKVGDWVVTPRRGKAVEINALWYNALCLLADWLRDAQDPEADGDRRPCRADARFVQPALLDTAGGYLYDVVDGENGDDPSFRPNQIFAISLDHPVLDRERWPAVVARCTKSLLTPVGLRSLAPGEPDYKPRYFGDLRARDAAYHQGTVWAWLIGPFIDAWLRVHPDDRRRRGVSSTALSRISPKPASARSARSSMPSRRSRRAAASPRLERRRSAALPYEDRPGSGMIFAGMVRPRA